MSFSRQVQDKHIIDFDVSSKAFDVSLLGRLKTRVLCIFLHAGRPVEPWWEEGDAIGLPSLELISLLHLSEGFSADAKSR